MPYTAYIDTMPIKAYNAAMDYLIRSPSQLASHLRSLRKTRHLTQAQLGTLVGLDQTRIAKIEKDPRRISAGQLLKILSALGMQVVLRSKPAAANNSSDDAASW